MKIEITTNSPAELQDKFGALCCGNKNTTEELRAYVVGIRDGLRRVQSGNVAGSVRAGALADVLDDGLGMCAGPCAGLDLAKLSVWAGQIKIGWL